MIQFYLPGLPDDTRLPDDEAAHCLRVLRMKEGDTLEAIDGRGNRYTCRLTDVTGKRASVEIVESHAAPESWPAPLTIAVAPTKHIDRMEWLVEKLTETGVDRIVPMLCDRSERRELRADRLERIAVSAMKQSLKATLPTVEPMTRIGRIIEQFGPEAGPEMQRFIAYCADDVAERVPLARLYKPGRPMVLLIGPEGDFTPAEVARALEAGFVAVTLGDQRLRTETAALAGCTAAHVLNQAAGL